MATQKKKYVATLEIEFPASNCKEAEDLFNWMCKTTRKYTMGQNDELFANLKEKEENQVFRHDWNVKEG